MTDGEVTMGGPGRVDRAGLLARVVPRLRRGLVRRAGGRSGRGAILLYHRIGDPGADPWRMGVSAETFRGHLEMLASEFRPLELDELLDGVERRRIPAGAVAISFDDGYADNLSHALPALEAVAAPATVYVASGFIGSGRRFWWDRITAAVTAASAVPESISLTLGGAERGIRLNSDREQAGRALAAAMRLAVPEEIEDAVGAIEALAPGVPEPEQRPLREDELAELNRSELITIGAHTRTHPDMTLLDADEQRQELEGCRDDLAGVIGVEPTAFSYPFGLHGPGPRRAVAAAGFRSAAGTHRMPVNWLSSRLELGRIWVDEMSADDLASELTALGV